MTRPDGEWRMPVPALERHDGLGTGGSGETDATRPDGLPVQTDAGDRAKAADLPTPIGVDILGDAVLDPDAGDTVTLPGTPPKAADPERFLVV